MSVAYIDTQVAIWLHAGAAENLTQEARRQIQSNELLLSPMALLEMGYLFERKRVNFDAQSIYSYLHAVFGIVLCSYPFTAIAQEALACTWTRDPFDRIIVSHAKANGEAPLITADRKIRQNYPNAKW